MRIAIIGAGISGIGTAHILKKNGHNVTIFEKSSELGGVWAVAYPEVRLQNSSHEYHFSDFPWPFKPDLHPTAVQIKRYLNEAVEHFQLDLRLEHEISAMEEKEQGWLLQYRSHEKSTEEFFDYIVIATGQYTEGKNRPQLEGEAVFQGKIVTEREIKNLDDFKEKEVVVLGFGKSAVDMATLAASRAKQVHHVFRTARWLVPKQVFGLHDTYPFFYYKDIFTGKILPYRSNIAGFSEGGIKLENDQEVSADLVILSIGSKSPTFPFLPQKYREILEKEVDGVQLYRHLIHPEVPRIGFAGFNHGFMHVPAVEVGGLWLSAHLVGDLALPSKEDMLQSIEHIQDWKRTHIHFESSRNCAVNIRFQQYLDTLLKDLRLSPYRKFPNVVAEVFDRYGAADYKGLSEDYQRKREQVKLPLALNSTLLT